MAVEAPAVAQAAAALLAGGVPCQHVLTGLCRLGVVVTLAAGGLPQGARRAGLQQRSLRAPGEGGGPCWKGQDRTGCNYGGREHSQGAPKLVGRWAQRELGGTSSLRSPVSPPSPSWPGASPPPQPCAPPLHSPAAPGGRRQRPVMGSNSSAAPGQMQRKEPSTFSQGAAPHTPCSVSHSFTSVQRGWVSRWAASSAPPSLPPTSAGGHSPPPPPHLPKQWRPSWSLS